MGEFLALDWYGAVANWTFGSRKSPNLGTAASISELFEMAGSA